MRNQDQGKYKLEPVIDSRGNKIPNLNTRNGVFYVQCSVHGKRYLRRCPYDKLTPARRWVRQFIAAAKAKRTDDLEESRARRAFPKVGRFIELYLEAADRQFAIAGKPLPRTVRKNVAYFRNIITTVTGSKRVDELNLDVVSKELAEKYLQIKTAPTGSVDFQMQHRARLSAASPIFRRLDCRKSTPHPQF